MTNKRRLGIFFFYDKNGVADPYVDYLLKDISQCFDKLIIVSNGPLSFEAIRIFNSYTSHIIVRENKGFDVWAYKTAIDNCGWKEINSYFEIVLFNFTIMGPVYSFVEVFNDMDQVDVDFWGLNVHYGVDYDPTGVNPYGYLPKHLQSHFIAFRNCLTSSEAFHKYWNNLPNIKSYEDAVGKHESYLTKHFEDLGFSWTSFTKTDSFSNQSEYPLIDYPVEVLRDCKCPIFKRKSFFVSTKHFSQRGAWSNAGRALFSYLENETDYDTDMIVQNMIRTQNESEYSYPLRLIGQIITDVPKANHKIAVIVNTRDIAFEFEIEEISKRFPDKTDFFFCETDDPIKSWKNLFTGVNICFDTYEFVCVISPYLTTHGCDYGSDSVLRSAIESLLGSTYTVNSIIAYFENNPRVGQVTSARPKNSDNLFRYSYFSTLRLFDDPIFQGYSENYIPNGNGIGVYWLRTKSLCQMDEINLSSSFKDAHYYGAHFDLLIPVLIKQNAFCTFTVVTFDAALDNCIVPAPTMEPPIFWKEKLKKQFPGWIVNILRKIKRTLTPRTMAI